MRIVHLEAGRHLYGGARQVEHLINGLSELGVDNVLVCPHRSAVAETNVPADIIELPLRGDLDVSQTVRLARVLRSRPISLLHVHSRRGADLYGGRAAQRAGIASLITRRVESFEPAAWLHYKLRPYARIVAISRAIERDLTVRAGLARHRVVRVPSAVALSTVQRRDSAERLRATLEIPEAARVIGTVAQLIPRKGHATLLRAFADATRRQPDLWLVIFGRGPREAPLRRWAEQLHINERVVFAGFRDNIAALMPGLDVMVHAAAREGLGVAVLEAMAAGVPVVATRVGGVPDIIDDGISGLLVRPGDTGAIAAAIERLLEDTALSQKLAERGRQHVASAFSIERMARAYLNLYRETLREHGGVG
jgi:glycosyltransferase involved in cell wall biosynthesis